MKILVTGSEGLIGRHLCPLLESFGNEVVRMDVALPLTDMDVRAPAWPRAKGCDGIIHLAAVSRVVWGVKDPHGCIDTNIRGTLNAVAAAKAAGAWLLFASSREVYGNVLNGLATEDTPFAPTNVYASTKVLGEEAVRTGGVRAAIVRFSGVYGDTMDHVDRVIPAFCRGTALGEIISLRGDHKTFDFVHVDDAIQGVGLMVAKLAHGETLPPIHLVSGQGATLAWLIGTAATEAQLLGAPRAAIRVDPWEAHEVGRFVGDPRRARHLLGWSPQVGLREGIAKLVRDYVKELT